MSPDYRDGIDWGWQDQSRQANPGDATNDYAKYEEFLASRPVVHPAALVLADHQRLGFTRSATDPAVCDCGWRGQLCDHPAHLAEVLDRAGLLAVRAVAALDPMPLCPKCGTAVTLWTDLNHAARADCDACGYSTFDAARDI